MANSCQKHVECDLTTKLVATLSRLVAFPTLTYDYKVLEKAFGWIEGQLVGLPVYCKRVYGKDSPNLLVTTQPTQTPTCWLVAHLDVVPGAPTQFKPVLQAGKLFGRGAYDMKMALALFLVLFQALGVALAKLNIGLMISSDEEKGGMAGVGHLLSSGYGSKVALIPDGGFNWQLETKAKGVCLLEVIAQGHSAHGSRPWEGENAITKLCAFLGQVELYFKERKLCDPTYYATCNLATISGGKVFNQVPSQAKAQLDIRYPPDEAPHMLIEQLQTMARNSSPGIEINTLGCHAPHQLDLSSPYVASFRTIADALYGIKVGDTISHGASDARFFGKRGIPALVVAPKGGDHHGPNEWVDIQDLVRFYHVVKKWVLAIQ